MTPFAHGETVTRQRATSVSSGYGNGTQLDWTTPATRALTGCAVWSGPTEEPIRDARNMVTSDYVVAAPHGADVTPLDRLVIRGRVCQVVGRPFDWTSPFTGWQPGTIIQANVVEG